MPTTPWCRGSSLGLGRIASRGSEPTWPFAGALAVLYCYLPNRESGIFRADGCAKLAGLYGDGRVV